MTLNNFSTKICKGCQIDKIVSEFSKSKTNKDGTQYECKSCVKDFLDRYRKTKEGVVTTIYSNQRGKSKKRGHVMPSYTNIELREWLFSQDKFHKLYNLWKESGYLKDNVPSCDRLDDYNPYTLDNLQIMTWKENKDKGHYDIKNGINNKISKAVVQMDLEGNFIFEHHSSSQAERVTSIDHSDIVKCCKEKRQTAGGYKWSYA